MFDFAKLYYLIFGILTILGGIMGYVSKRSIASLVAGAICGTLLLFAAYAMHSKVNEPLILALVVSVALAGKFVPAYMVKKGFFPNGIMGLLSIIGIVVTVLAWNKR